MPKDQKPQGKAPRPTVSSVSKRLDALSDDLNRLRTETDTEISELHRELSRRQKTLDALLEDSPET